MCQNHKESKMSPPPPPDKFEILCLQQSKVQFSLETLVYSLQSHKSLSQRKVSEFNNVHLFNSLFHFNLTKEFKPNLASLRQSLFIKYIYTKVFIFSTEFLTNFHQLFITMQIIPPPCSPFLLQIQDSVFLVVFVSNLYIYLCIASCKITKCIKKIFSKLATYCKMPLIPPPPKHDRKSKNIQRGPFTEDFLQFFSVFFFQIWIEWTSKDIPSTFDVLDIQKNVQY